MPEFTDHGGVGVSYDVYPATGTPRGVVQILHGVGEHAGRYVELAENLAAAGFIVYADDHRGHGRTGMRQHAGDASQLGRLGKGGMPGALHAVWQFTQLIRKENPDLPLVLLGHSWGSFLAQMLVNDHASAYDALVLSGSALRLPTSMNPFPLNRRWAGPDAMGTEWLAADLSVGRAFLADPLCTDTPLLKLFGFFDAARLYGRPRRNLGRDLPVLLMVGEDDPVGGPGSVHKLAQEYRSRSGLDDVTEIVYPGARHEIFNDYSKQEATADLLAWLDERIAIRA